ncbi:interleukin-12 receptor subunit beta-2-like [Ptychodera flava]|uniref:interleukin-12 receptor subunit beta-2-like n=1 Tax=Ptychodera flava TaxID=63121 RepID=UPI00396A4964
MAICTLSTSIHVSLIILYAIALAEASLVIVSEKTTFEVGDTIVINCTTVSHSAQSVQWFFNSNPIPENQYTVISAELSQLVIPQSNFSNAGNYSCALLEALLEKTATVQIEVGEKPHPISSFKCFSFFITELLCTWDDGGPTNIPTTRTLMYKELYAHSKWTACEDTGTSGYCPDLHSYNRSCSMGNYAHLLGPWLNFTVITENALGTAATWLYFNFDTAVPFAPSNTKAIAKSGECVAVSWDYPCEGEHIMSVVLTSSRLQYRLRYKSEWDADEWDNSTYQEDVKTKRVCKLEGYTHYSIQVSARLFYRHNYWSDWSDIVVVRTLEQAPISPLEISYENMDSQDESSKRDVTVYWKPLGLRKMKGEVLGYTIAINKEGENITISVNASANATSQVLKGLEKYASYNIHVITFNSAGSSPPSSLTILDLALVIVSEKTTFEVGDTIVINCTTVSHSAQSVQWFFNSHPIPENQYTVISAELSQLVIPQSNFSNAGNYSCALLEALLEKTATVQIEVGEKPHPISSFKCFSFYVTELLCTWDDGGPTNIPTTHTLMYKEPNTQ